jgi:hypothetical protein
MQSQTTATASFAEAQIPSQHNYRTSIQEMASGQ